MVLGFVDVICTALGAGLYERSAALGCTIIGSTGMHMRLAQSADEVVLNSERTGYTMAMPVPGVYAQMQSNMASTLNIDWLLDVAVDMFASQGIKKSRSELVPMVDSLLGGSRPTGILYQPYVSEAGERGPFINADARAGFIGLSNEHGFGDLMRGVVDGLALAGRDCYQAMGSRPEEIRLTGGGIEEHRNPTNILRRPGYRSADVATRGSGSRRSCHDSRGGRWSICRYGRLCRRMGVALSG